MIDVYNYWLGPFTVGGMSLLDASLAISGHEVSEEEFLTKYISHPDEVADCRTGWVDLWLVAVWFRNSEEMWVVQEKWSALGTIRSYVDTVPHRGVFGPFLFLKHWRSASFSSNYVLILQHIYLIFDDFHYFYTNGYV